MTARAPEVSLHSASECATRIGVSQPTWWRMVSRGDIAPPIRIGGRSMWRSDEIDAFIEDRTRERHNLENQRR